MVDFMSSAVPQPKEPSGVAAEAGAGAAGVEGPQGGNGGHAEGHHLRQFVGRTRGMLKSRLRSVLAGSNDLLSGLSTRLESALSLSTDTLSDSSTTTTEGDADDDDYLGGASTRSTTDASAAAAPAAAPATAAEVFSKKLRLPQLGHALSFEDYSTLARHKRKKDRKARGERSSRVSLPTEQPSQPPSTPQPNPQPPSDDHAASLQPPGAGPGGAKGTTTRSSHSSASVASAASAASRSSGGGGVPQTLELQATGPDPYDKLHYKTEAPSSGSASDLDGYGPSTSLDSDQDGKKYWVRSGSEGSVQSWASSLSYESQSDEVTAEAVEFMRRFVSELFKDSASIPLDQKSKFGKLAQHEAGRLWFARFVNAQRVHHKKVDESTFYSLVQYFAIVLFECADADDFSPAKSLMNMCFTFYHEVEVPGCEPYKEYLYTYLREQSIWHSLRFWNAAFFDALQCERVHRPVVTREDITSNALEAITDEKQYQENITFGQLGTFTYNMHAFGLSKELCSEFLRKQCFIANLSEEQEKMLRDNVERMYKETDPWR